MYQLPLICRPSDVAHPMPFCNIALGNHENYVHIVDNLSAEEINDDSEDKWSPFMYAAIAHNAFAFGKMFLLGGDVLKSNREGTHVLGLAAKWGAVETLAEVCRALCCDDRRYAIFKAASNEDKFPFLLKCRNYEECRRCQSVGDLLSTADDSGCTAMHYAAGSGQYKVVVLLGEWGANANAADYDSCTPLDYASGMRCRLTWDYLMRYHAVGKSLKWDAFFRCVKFEVGSLFAQRRLKQNQRKAQSTQQRAHGYSPQIQSPIAPSVHKILHDIAELGGSTGPNSRQPSATLLAPYSFSSENFNPAANAAAILAQMRPDWPEYKHGIPALALLDTENQLLLSYQAHREVREVIDMQQSYFSSDQNVDYSRARQYLALSDFKPLYSKPKRLQ